jgi:hypothetical protein
MCPICIATAALIAGKVTSASGVAASAIRKLGRKKAEYNDFASTPSKQSANEDEADGINPNSNQRRDHYANDCGSEREDRVA